MAEAATRYLAVEHALAAPAAYRAVLDQVRAVARRRGDSRWRLLGLELQAPQVGTSSSAPSLDEWAEAEGLGDWSADELQLIYAERFGSVDASRKRRQARNARLREKRLLLLRELEAAAAVPAAESDLVEGWLPGEISEVLRRAGVLTLGDLRGRIAVGGRWWRGLPAVGPTKAERLRQLLDTLLAPGEDSRTAAWPLSLAPAELARLSGAHGCNRLALSAGSAGIAAEDDRQAIRAWVAARAGSPLTATQYEREAERCLLWCVLERGKALSDATAEDCRAYMDFIANVPLRWISRRRVPRLTPGWAPFAGPLSIASQQLAITVVASMFAWLVQAGYLVNNPWALVNRRLGDDEQLDIDDPGSRAFTPTAWSALISHLDRAAPSPSVARLRWICIFVQMTGLRAAELLRAQRGHLVERTGGWAIKVHGKGRRNRLVPVPSVAVAATRAYFENRGLDFDQAGSTTPLLASLVDGVVPITYQALHQTFTRFVRRAVLTSRLDQSEREQALRASAHWLRHTYATRAAERDVPLDVLQENLGQADPRTTARYYRAQMKRRQQAIEAAFAPGKD